MKLRPDSSLLVEEALSMSRLSNEELSPDAAEVATLVRLTLGGDATAFEQIIRRYERRVMALAARLLGARDDAQDVAQEVFLRAFKYLHRLDVQKPVEPWLMRIVANTCRDAARRTQRRRERFVAIVLRDSFASLVLAGIVSVSALPARRSPGRERVVHALARRHRADALAGGDRHTRIVQAVDPPRFR